MALPLLALGKLLIPFLAPKIAEAIGGDKAESISKTVVGIAEAVTGKQGEAAVEVLKADPAKALEFLKAQMDDKHVELRECLQDTQNARQMQIEALRQGDIFSKRFLYYFIMGWSVFVAIYIVCITFVDIPSTNVRFADTILGFLLGTILGTIFNFLLGTSQGSVRAQQMMRDMLEKGREIVKPK